MSEEIELYYCLRNQLSQTFLLAVHRESTVQDVLDIISEKHKNKYKILFYNQSEIDLDELIIDLIDDDPYFIFVASLNSNPPPKNFATKIIKNNEYQTEQPKEYNTNNIQIENPNSPPKPIPKLPLPKIPTASIKPPEQTNNSPKPIPKLPSPKIPNQPIKPTQQQQTKIAPSPSPSPNPNVSFPPKIAKAPMMGKELTHATPNVITPSQHFTPNVNTSNTDRFNYMSPIYIIKEYSSLTPIERSEEESEQYSRKATNYKSKDFFTFYCTGGDKNLLLKGIKVKLILSMNQKQCNEALLEYLKEKVDITDKQLLVYLPGGIPFIEGKLGDIYLNKDLKVKNVIYGVLTRSVPDNVITDTYHEICNLKEQYNKILISPLVDSSIRGLSDMACLMGYLNHDGIKNMLLLKACAKVIHFPPFIASMKRIIERKKICGRDIITVTSTFYTFFRVFLPLYCPDNRVFEYTLTLCNVIIYAIDEYEENIPIIEYDVNKEDKSIKFLSDMKYENIIYFWKGDAGFEYKWFDIQFQIDELIENSDKIISSFTPIDPLAMRTLTGCTIIKGKNHEFLYLMQSVSKNAQTNDNVDILNPITGAIESVNHESFSLSQIRMKKDNAPDLIKEDRVKQIIVIDFDESIEMYSDIDGNYVHQDCEKNSRYKIGYQFIRLFLDFLYYNRIPCIQSLVRFNKDIEISNSFSTIYPDAEICFNEKPVTKKSSSKLWDSLSFCCNEIKEFRKDKKGKEKYVNAISRILVISTGLDHNSISKVHHVTKKLIKNNVIVDSIILSQDERSKMLCAVSHATGGLSFCPKNIQECILLFDHPAFVNYEIREINHKPLIMDDISTLPSHLKCSMITKSFMNNARDNAMFDNEIICKELYQSFKNVSLATPRYICSKYKDSLIPNIRQRRILKELHEAIKITEYGSQNYDPDIIIFPVQSRIDLWMAFIRSPETESWSIKWWHLLIIFPELYPFHSPIFKFISVPYHPNISKDGYVCIDSLCDYHILDKSVVDILQDIKELFLLPNVNKFIQIGILDIYIHYREKYYRLQKESTDKNAKENYNDFIKSFSIVDDIIDESVNKISDSNPPKEDSNEKQKKGIKESSIIFDKEELKQLISNKNPKIEEKYSSDDCI